MMMMMKMKMTFSMMMMMVVLLSSSFAEVSLATVPRDLSNFQNVWQCPSDVYIGRPRTIEQLQTLVKQAKHVRANGLGHSWNTQHFCPASAQSAAAAPEAEANTIFTSNGGGGKDSVNVQLRTISPKQIIVDEENLTVLVDAGVKTRDLLNYLSEFGDGSGYTLPAFSWFIDQTIGGAVATGTHGSSLEYGSFSSEKQLLGVEMVLANGTLVNLTPDTHPQLMRAARVSAGRLGVITKVKLRLVPEMRVRREMNDRLQSVMFNAINEGQRLWNEEGKLSPALNETQFLWWIQQGRVFHVQFERLEATRQDRSKAERAPMVIPQVPNPGPLILQSQGFSTFLDPAIRSVVSTSVAEARDSFITMTEPLYEMHRVNMYDQYEISVPFSTMGNCFNGLRDLLRRNIAISQSFFSPALVRFVSQEEGLLSQTEDGPRLYINIEDYLFYVQGRIINTGFKQVMAYFRSDERCAGSRLHWGKAGWPDAGCWDGAEEYPNTWCDFGCAAMALDPKNKFADSGAVFSWQGSNLESCCSAEHKYQHGPGCQCQAGGRRSDCPAAPGYTNR
ncbi:FAD-binding PCMH-type domain-containing protein [Pseudoscourfieldia marina]